MPVAATPRTSNPAEGTQLELDARVERRPDALRATSYLLIAFGLAAFWTVVALVVWSLVA